MNKLSRIIDANCNRTREGLRVLEEIGRLWLDNESLFQSLKKLRHTFSDLENSIRTTYSSSIIARDSENDVGDVFIPQLESNRCDIMSVAHANSRRVQESLRVLEEFMKLKDNTFVEQIKKIRFQAYSLEKKIKIELDR